MAKIDEWSTQDEINDVKMGRPHVVLLGAGASVAAMPNGDKHGRKLPVMDNFVEVVGLEPVLKKHGITNSNQNFETLYSGLVSDPTSTDVVVDIEKCVWSYFSTLELPDHPTIYDHLVLSLREKDLIATFNFELVLSFPRLLGSLI